MSAVVAKSASRRLLLIEGEFACGLSIDDQVRMAWYDIRRMDYRHDRYFRIMVVPIPITKFSLRYVAGPTGDPIRHPQRSFAEHPRANCCGYMGQHSLEAGRNMRSERLP